MKKIISMILAVGMLLGMLALPAFAATTDASEATNGKNFRIGAESSGTYYDTLENAIAALKDNGGTIVMIADYKQTMRFSNNAALNSVSGVDKAFVIDGNGHTLTMDDGSNDNAFFYRFTADIVFKNMTLVMRSGMRPNAYDGDDLKTTQSITFENCKVESCAVLNEDNTYGPSGRTFSFCVERTTLNLNFKNTTFNVYADTRCIAANRYGIINVSMENSTINIAPTARTIQVIELWHHSAKASFTLDGTSKIIADCIQLVDDDHAIVFEAQHANNELILNLAAGSEIKVLNNGMPFTTFLYAGSAGKAAGRAPVINDNGAKWTLGKDVLKSGVVLPDGVVYKTVANNVGWDIGGKLYPAGTVFKVEDATADAVITPVCIGADALTNVEGASVRTQDPYGIRFTAKLTASAYNTLKTYGKSVKYATLIAESSKLDAEKPVMSIEALGEGNYTLVEKAKWAEENVNGAYTYRGAYYAINDTKADFNTLYSATGCIVITYADGSVGYVYAAFDKTANSRTLCAVAQAAIAAGTTNNTMLNHIVATATAQ